MEMKKSNTNIPVREDVKDVAEKRKTLTPAVLGMPHSHGVKFSVNMTSEDKKELLAKLEEWRKIRKEKLAASILAKQKQTDKPRVIPMKNKGTLTGGSGSSKFPDGQSVFDRLYQNNTKVKKQDAPINKQQQFTNPNFRKSVLHFNRSGKLEKPVILQKDEAQILQTTVKSDLDKKKKQLLSSVEMAKQNDTDSVSNIEKTEEMAENDYTEIINEKFDNEKKEPEPAHYDPVIINPVKVTEKVDKGVVVPNPVHVITSQVKVTDAKSSESHPAFKSIPAKAVETCKEKPLLRRSISMLFHKKCRTEHSVRRSISVNNLHNMNLKQQRMDYKNIHPLQPCDEGTKKETKNEGVTKSVMFATPKSTKLLTSTDLRNKLEEWLKVNGHSLKGYRHLRCFGVTENPQPLAEATPIASDDSSGKFSSVPSTPDVDSDKENVTPPTVIQQANLKDVENWLEELHRLIVEVKYPPKRCEEWLAAIRKKCSGCSQLPIYWECLAALHESKGDLKSAIEDYERAIIKGGEVDSVGESLAQLFDKMVIEQGKQSKRKLEKGLDPKNIFRSTIIKFALQQKAIKKLSSELEPNVRQQLCIATPVRRSTRLQTPFKSTEEVASLQNLTPEIRKNVTFKPNDSLLSGD